MIASAPFQEVLSSALTPITLISGVGMLILCMTNRYSHCMDRIRGLVKIRTQGLKALRVEPDKCIRKGRGEAPRRRGAR